MNKFGILVLIVAAAVSGCGDGWSAQNSLQQPRRASYDDCLRAAIGGGTRLSAEDIRSLCSEAAQVIEPEYNFNNGGVMPSNDFTRCYDAAEAALKRLKVPDATRLAKLSCKYPDVK